MDVQMTDDELLQVIAQFREEKKQVKATGDGVVTHITTVLLAQLILDGREWRKTILCGNFVDSYLENFKKAVGGLDLFGNFPPQSGDKKDS
jgi:hypothetical protein